MANLTKEDFQRKTDYANRISKEGMDKIIYSILTKNTTEENAKIIKEQIDSKTYSDEMLNLFIELMPIADLSHKRHEIHSTSVDKFVEKLIELQTIGTQYSLGDSLIDDVNRINKKYHLVDDDVPFISEVELMIDVDSTKEILEYYGEEPSDDDNADTNRVIGKTDA
ncbi:MAG: hypothetical protein PUC37_01015 [Spirochaetales bacterium]|nr:hypothetical protein [Spirochaetales bacterium]